MQQRGSWNVWGGSNIGKDHFVTQTHPKITYIFRNEVIFFQTRPSFCT